MRRKCGRQGAPNTDRHNALKHGPPRTSAAHRPIGNRSPPLARAPPSHARWTAACSLRARLGVEEPARRGMASLSPGPSTPPPAERDRDAPSALVALPRTALGRHRRRPPPVGTCADGWRRAKARSGDSFSQTLDRVACSGDRPEQLANGGPRLTLGNTPSTRLRGRALGPVRASDRRAGRGPPVGRLRA